MPHGRMRSGSNGKERSQDVDACTKWPWRCDGAAAHRSGCTWWWWMPWLSPSSSKWCVLQVLCRWLAPSLPFPDLSRAVPTARFDCCIYRFESNRSFPPSSLVFGTPHPQPRLSLAEDFQGPPVPHKAGPYSGALKLWSCTRPDSTQAGRIQAPTGWKD